MKIRLWLCSLLSGLSAFSYADAPVQTQKAKNPYYAFVGSGYAWSLKAGIHNPDPGYWDAAQEGYNSDLGDSPFFTIGLGKQLWRILHLDLSYTYYQTFHYQKQQTGTSSTPGFTGARRTRYFDLDNQNVLFSASLYPWQIKTGCGAFTPYAGGGVGVGINRVSNFHTVAYDSSADVGSTTSIGGPVTKGVFAWRVLAGIRFAPKIEHFSFDLGYRYYNGGKFTGPSKIQNYTGGGATTYGKPWKGYIKSNEIYFTVNFDY